MLVSHLFFELLFVGFHIQNDKPTRWFKDARNLIKYRMNIRNMMEHQNTQSNIKSFILDGSDSSTPLENNVGMVSASILCQRKH